MRKITIIFMLFMCSLSNAQNYTLSSLVVNGVNDNWCGDIEEIYIPFIGCTGSPDPFATLTDANGASIFQSETNVDNASLDLTLNIPLTDFPYTLTIWDEDGMTNNDNLGSFTIDGSQTGTLTLSNNGTTITLSVMMSYLGCTDENALNYNPEATMNDGSCAYNSECSDSEDLIIIDILSDNWGYETSIELVGATGFNYLNITEFTNNTLNTFNVCVPNNGTYVFTISDTYGDGICCSNGSGSYTLLMCNEILVTGGEFEFEETTTIESCSFDGADIDGCTDPLSINYNALATIDDGSCVLFDCPNDFVSTDGNVFSAPEGSILTETSIQLPIATQDEMYSEYIQFYAPSVLEFDGTVITFNSATINSIGNLPNGLVYQCSPSSCTFNAEQNGCLGLIGTPTETGVFDLAITASVSVIYDGGFLGDIDIDFDIPYYGGNTYLDIAGIDAATINSFIPSFTLVVQESADVLGCRDPIANNYNPLANMDDGSCDYEILCDGIEVFIDLQTTAFAYEISWEILNVDSDTVFLSSQSYNDNNVYDFELCLDPMQTYYVDMHDEYGDGWMDSELTIYLSCNDENFTLLSTSLDSGFNQTEEFYTSCSLVYGCTNELASNFDSLANIDNDSCIIPVAGCTDTYAVNYNPLAEVDDSSCNFFECNDEGISTEAGFYPPEGSTYNEDSSYVYLPDAILGTFYEEYLKFFAEDTMVLEGLEIGFISAKILNIINMPQGLYYQTSSADSTFYPSNVGCVGLFGEPELEGVYELSIEAEVTIEILGSPISFQLPYTGGVMILDLVYSDGDYTTLNNFIPTFVIEVVNDSELETVYGCTDNGATNYDLEATINDDSCVWTHVINLGPGWNLFSTYINPIQDDIIELFSGIIDSVVIVKNNSGIAYLPEWGFNGIGNIVYSDGYQVKTIGQLDFLIMGVPILPEENPLLLTAGWNMISYLRIPSADASLVFESITADGNLVIAKNNEGSAYLPEWNFNGIGNLESGNGYQIKIVNDQSLLYLSNNQEY